MPMFAVTLKPHNRPPSMVILPPDRHGEMPAVMINPRDMHGSVVPGLWLHNDRDDYEKVEGSGWH